MDEFVNIRQAWDVFRGRIRRLNKNQKTVKQNGKPVIYKFFTAG